MRRRIVWATAAIAVLLVVPSSPASAADVTFTVPDGDVTGSTPIEIRVSKSAAEPVNRAYVTLHRGEERIGERVRMACSSGCDDGERRRTFTLPDNGAFEPATRKPFGSGAPLDNGAYRLQVELDRGAFLSPQTFNHDLHLAVPPAAPKGVAADVDGKKVTLSWNPTPEADLAHYRVERHEGDGWEVLETTSGTSASDEPGEGRHRYRIVAERSDGRDGRVETASSEVTAEVEPPEEDTDGSRERDDADDPDAEDDERNGGADRDDEADSDPDRGAQAEETQSSDASSSGSSSGRSRSGRADAPSVGGGRSGSIPGLSGGDDDGYSQELDYGALGENGADGGADDVMVANPSGWRGTMDSILDAERVAVPIAAGLVMTATGLHLWRWLRVPLP